MGKQNRSAAVQEEMVAMDMERRGWTRDGTWRQNRPDGGMDSVGHRVRQRAAGDSWVPRSQSIKISPVKLFRERSL